VTFGAGVLFFPISYVFGDILTEVYGLCTRAQSDLDRFCCDGFCCGDGCGGGCVTTGTLVEDQAAYEVAFGNTWRIVLASLTAYACGEFVNSFVLARLKVAMNGRKLWVRTIGSTIVGEAVDSMLFYPLAFWGTGIIPDEKLPVLMLSQWIVKSSVEILFTPLTYKIVNGLKRAEGEDYYDRDTDFNPFNLKDS
jgi:uncharacterized PurR-regulated membrane protein YhhQ (DUF165 family)